MRTLLEPAGKIQLQTEILNAICFLVSRNAFPDPEIQTFVTSYVRSGEEVNDILHELDAHSLNRRHGLPYSAFL
jgi:hypothetical protein